MRKVLLLLVALLLPSIAYASCPNQVSSLAVPSFGNTPVHLTIYTSATACAVDAPANVVLKFTPAGLGAITLSATSSPIFISSTDGTGFNLLGAQNAGGGTSGSLSFVDSTTNQTGSISASVAAVPLVAGSP